MIFAPTFCSVTAVGRQGVGNEQRVHIDPYVDRPGKKFRQLPISKTISEEALRRMGRIHLHIRKTCTLPAQAVASMGVAIPKKGATKQVDPTKYLRLLHIFCYWWRLFLRAIVKTQGSIFQPTPWCYGGIASRRREDLMMITKIAMWKLREADVAHLVKSYDLTNAFGAGSTRALKTETEERVLMHGATACRRQNAALATLQRQRAIITLESSSGPCFLAPQCGGRMGCSNEPEIFMGIFNPAVADWNRRMYQVTGRSMVCTPPWEGMACAGDMGAFLDDLIRVIPTFDDGYASLLELDREDNKILNEALATVQLKQNETKQETGVYVKGRAFTRMIDKHVMGRALPALMHLGGMIVVRGSNQEEIKNRLAASNLGWNRLGSFWFAKTPWRLKRLIFLANIQARLLSGLISFTQLPSETKRLDRSMGKKLRAMLMGKAYRQTEQSHRKWTTQEVFRWWRLPPSAIELMVLRIGWWQSIARDPDKRQQLLTVFFG